MTISERLQSAVRDTDTFPRLGGDEFVLVWPDEGGEKLSAESMQRIMEVVSQPIVIEEKNYFLGCSIGVSIYPSDGETSGLLIERADMAMYRAKKLGRNNFQLFSEDPFQADEFATLLRNRRYLPIGEDGANNSRVA